jgi:peptidyl-prolyl cis-trans isomerase SurA
MMTFRLLRTPAVSARALSVPALFVLGIALLAAPITMAQTRPAEPASPYGGMTLEEIIARVNDQIITRSDYDRAMKELDDEGHQRGLSMQQIAEAHKDLLRNLIDQQLWISKGKELGITGDTELITRLNELRKQYNLATMEDLQKAAEEQGVSFEDFKANIRNQIITQQVMRDEVGRHINITPGEAQRYFEEHKQDYAQPESAQFSEILVSTGDNPDDAQVAAARAKADDVEAKLKAGNDFAQLARTSSEGQTAGEGGDMGQVKRGALAKVLEDAIFGLKAGQFTEPIRTRQGFVIFKVTQHTPGGVPAYKDVEDQVDNAYYMTKMDPAMRDYLTKMREDAYINIKPGYDDTGATANKRINPIAYSSYTPPAPKKKKKVERTRFRENAHFRQKSPQVVEASANTTTPAATQAKADTSAKASEKPGKKEKIRFGKAPTKTLPSAAAPAQTEDAGGASGATGETATGTQVAQGQATQNQADQSQVAQNQEPDNPLDQAAAQKKTRFSDRARAPKEKKAAKEAAAVNGPDPNAPTAPDATEVADKQTQSQPLGLGGDTASKKKKTTNATTGEKTRFSERPKDATQPQGPAPQPTPIPQTQGAPAPAQTPAPTTAPAPAPQQ